MTASIEIENLSKTYWSEDGKTETKVILPMSMSISEGEMVMFLGPSGCGKTTLMRIVGGLEHQDEGTVLLNGERLDKPDRRRGMVFQSYSSFPWLTVRENVKFGTRYRKDISEAEKQEVTDHYLAVQSREEMVWLLFEAVGLLCPLFCDELDWC